MKTVVALIVILAGAYLFGWRDLFHLALGLPLILIAAVILHWCRKRIGLDEEPHEESSGRRILAGVALGLFFIAFFAAGLAVASRTRLPEVLGARDCQELRLELRILQEGKAFPRIVELVDQRIHEGISRGCRDNLREMKVRALWGWAEATTSENCFAKLQQALTEARESGMPILCGWLNSDF